MRGDLRHSIDLLRHGETTGGARLRGTTDDPLTASGWNQMWHAVTRTVSPEMVMTSPLARCADFARVFARRHALPLRVDARLRELDFGAWEGRTAEEIEETAPLALRRFYADPWRHGPPDGETLEQLRTRVLAAWRETCALGYRVLIITHGGPIKLILCHALGLVDETLAHIDVPHAKLYRFTGPMIDRFLSEAPAR